MNLINELSNTVFRFDAISHYQLTTMIKIKFKTYVDQYITKFKFVRPFAMKAGHQRMINR